jgi:uncharacterized protein (DUF58 family)
MPRARTTAALGSLLVVAGVLFDTPSLIVPGAAILALSAAAVAWVEGAALRVRVSRRPGPPRVIEGQAYPLAVSIDRGGLPLPGAELRDPALDAPLALGPRPPESVTVEIRLERRGRRVLEPATLVVADPFGLRRREVSSDHASDVLVLPRTEPVRAAGPGGGPAAGWRRRGTADGDDGEAARREGSAPSVEIDGLRPHREGAPASRIHWPTAARTGELFERRMIPGAESAHAIVLDASRPATEDSLDRAVRAAASLCLSLAADGGCALHLPGESRAVLVGARLEGWPHAHAALAVVQPNATPPAAGTARATAGGTTVWVDGGAEPLDPRELRRLASAATHVVTAAQVGGMRPVLSVAGCWGYRLGGRASRASRAAAPEAAV